MTWILDKFNSWNFRGICYENGWISIGFGLIFDQTAVKKTWENPCHIFYRDDRISSIIMELNEWSWHLHVREFLRYFVAPANSAQLTRDPLDALIGVEDGSEDPGVLVGEKSSQFRMATQAFGSVTRLSPIDMRRESSPRGDCDDGDGNEE